MYELILTFRVPETDFDFIAVECAIKALEKELEDYRHRDNHGLMGALRILNVVRQRYLEVADGAA